jgi:hypothetical protein
VISCVLKKEDDENRAHIRRAMENIWSKSSAGNVVFVLQFPRWPIGSRVQCA